MLEREFFSVWHLARKDERTWVFVELEKRLGERYQIILVGTEDDIEK